VTSSFRAGPALVPHPGDRPADEQHRKVPGLAAGQGAFGGAAGEEQFARLAADGVGVEVGQQPEALRRRRRGRVPGQLPCEGAVDLDVLQFIGQGVEQRRRPPPRRGQPLCELL
jgi:hypothetical protein